MRGPLAAAAGARPPLRGGARFRSREATTRLPRRVCRGSRVARASGRPDDGRPARKSESALNLGGLESWADEPAAAEAPRSSARWDDAWEDTWPERRASASRGSRPDFGLDDNGEPVDRAGTSGDAEWDEDLDGDGDRDPYGDGDGDGDPYAYRDAYSPRDAPASFGESLPGAAGAAVSWLLKAVALISDATATNLAFLFPRAVPRATLRALAFGAWALLFFAVFQKLLSTIVLVGGAALLAVAVASGEFARGGSESARRNFDTRNRGTRPSRGAWGSRGESFDAFVDGMGRRRRDAFWRGATARSTRAMREFWNAGDVPGDDVRAYGDIDARAYGDDRSASSEPFFGPADARADAKTAFENDDAFFEHADFQGKDASDWPAAATEAAAAAAATAAAAVRAAAEAARGAAEGGPGGKGSERGASGEPAFGEPAFGEVKTFDGAAGAADAGFAFRTSRAVRGLKETQAAADVVVDVEAVPFDDWVGRRSEGGKTKEEKRASRDAKDEDAPFSSPDADDVDERTEDSAADALDDDAFVENERSFGRDRSTRPRANERARGDRRDAYGTYETGGYDRWASVSRNALDDAARLASSALGVDGAGRGGRTVAGSSSGERENRWREFLTGRFYGAFQEDVVPVRFARDARNAMDPLTDPLAAGANEDSRERTNRVATAERRKKTTSDVPANGRFVDGAWIDDGAENGDDVGGSPSFGSSASSASSASSDGQGGDGDEPLGTAR